MTKRATMITVGVICSALMIGTLVASASGEGGNGFGKADRQAIHWQKTPQTTTDPEWTYLLPEHNNVIPGVITVTNRGPVSVSFSGDFSGAPVDIQATQDGREMEPGFAHFDPASGTTSFSFDFVHTDGNGRVSCRTYAIQWRSPTGEAVTFNRGSFIVDYHHDNTTRSGSRIGCL